MVALQQDPFIMQICYAKQQFTPAQAKACIQTSTFRGLLNLNGDGAKALQAVALEDLDDIVQETGIGMDTTLDASSPAGKRIAEIMLYYGNLVCDTLGDTYTRYKIVAQ